MTLINFDTETFLTAGQVAKILNISAATVYRNIRTQVWPSVKMAGSVRIPKSLLVKTLESNLVLPEPETNG